MPARTAGFGSQSGDPAVIESPSAATRMPRCGAVLVADVVAPSPHPPRARAARAEQIGRSRRTGEASVVETYVTEAARR
jgi:hypothetical protein